MDSLPPELLIDIVEQLDLRPWALSLTCKRLHEICTPMVWHDFEVKSCPAPCYAPFVRRVSARSGVKDTAATFELVKNDITDAVVTTRIADECWGHLGDAPTLKSLHLSNLGAAQIPAMPAPFLDLRHLTLIYSTAAVLPILQAVVNSPLESLAIRDFEFPDLQSRFAPTLWSTLRTLEIDVGFRRDSLLEFFETAAATRRSLGIVGRLESIKIEARTMPNKDFARILRSLDDLPHLREISLMIVRGSPVELIDIIADVAPELTRLTILANELGNLAAAPWNDANLVAESLSKLPKLEHFGHNCEWGQDWQLIVARKVQSIKTYAVWGRETSKAECTIGLDYPAAIDKITRSIEIEDGKTVTDVKIKTCGRSTLFFTSADPSFKR